MLSLTVRVNVAIKESMERDEGASDKDRYVQTCGKGHGKVMNTFMFERCIEGNITHDN